MKFLRSLTHIFQFDLKRNINKMKVTFLLLFIFGALLINQIGIELYIDEINNAERFVELEKIKTERYCSHIRNYAIFGFRRLFISSPLYSLFYNSSPIGNLETFIDGSVRIDINQPQIGRNIFRNQMGGNLDLSWYILFIGTVIVSIWNFFAFRPQKYLNFLTNLSGNIKSVYLGILLSRIFIISVGFSILGLLVWVQFRFINNIIINAQNILQLLFYFVVALLILSFFTIISSIFGIQRSVIRGATIMVAFWVLMSIFTPEIIDSVLYQKTKSKNFSRFENETDKFEILAKFEDSLKQKYKILSHESYREVSKQMFENYWKNSLKNVIAIDELMLNALEENTKKLEFWSILTPICFYKITSIELSSRSSRQLLRLYQESIDHYRGFVRFFIDHLLYKKNQKVEPFLKNSEYIFQAKSSLPHYFWIGLALNSVYVLLLLFFGYIRFKKMIFPKIQDEQEFEKIDFEWKQGKHYTYRVKKEAFAAQIFNIFNGIDHNFSGKIVCDGEKFTGRGRKKFLYFLAPSTIPGDVSTSSLIDLFANSLGIEKENKQKLIKSEIGCKKLSTMEDGEIALLLARLFSMSDYDLILVENLSLDSPKQLDLIFNTLKKNKQVLVIELLNETVVFHNSFDRYSGIFYFDNQYQENVLEKDKRMTLGT